MRAAALLFLAPGLLAQGTPQSLAETLTAHLKATPLLHADFTQIRTLAALSRPLKSSGSLVVSRDQGVIWRMARPMPLTLVVGPRGVLELDREGHRKVQSAQELPMVAQMARIMKSVLEGKWSAVDDLFTVKGEAGPGSKWSILLAPRPQTAAYLKEVRIRGGAFIEGIRVVEASGDSMDMTFFNARADAPLTPAEAQLFAFE